MASLRSRVFLVCAVGLLTTTFGRRTTSLAFLVLVTTVLVVSEGRLVGISSLLRVTTVGMPLRPDALKRATPRARFVAPGLRVGGFSAGLFLWADLLRSKVGFGPLIRGFRAGAAGSVELPAEAFVLRNVLTLGLTLLPGTW